jgi:hypothetical protein
MPPTISCSNRSRVKMGPSSSSNGPARAIGKPRTNSVATEPDAQLTRHDLGLRFSGPGVAGLPAWSYDDDYLHGRCDARTASNGNTSRGCVNPVFIPTLNLSVTKAGSSANMVEWAQENLAGHYGRHGDGLPLHYKNNQGSSRAKMCNSFKQDKI